MYTILVNNDNTLTPSVKERIMQRSKLVDSLRFLVEPDYKGLNMADFTVTMEYVLPVSKKYKTEILVLSEELYKEQFLEYKLPFDTNLTSEAGDIQAKLTFRNVDLDEQGQDIQYVRQTSNITIPIIPISAWSDFIPDEALNALDQRLLKVDGQIKALSEMGELLAGTKADNIELDKETHELYLTAEGEQIGDRIAMEDLGDSIAQDSPDGLVTMII